MRLRQMLGLQGLPRGVKQINLLFYLTYALISLKTCKRFQGLAHPFAIITNIPNITVLVKLIMLHVLGE